MINILDRMRNYDGELILRKKGNHSVRLEIDSDGDLWLMLYDDTLDDTYFRLLILDTVPGFCRWKHATNVKHGLATDEEHSGFFGIWQDGREIRRIKE